MIEKRVIDTSSDVFEENVTNLVFNRLHSLYVPLNLEQEIGDTGEVSPRPKVTKPNDGFNMPLLNIELRPVDLTTDTDFGWTPSVHIASDSTIRSDQDRLSLSDSAMRLFIRMEFALSTTTGPPKKDFPDEPEDLTTQSNRLMADCRKVLSRNNFVNKNVGIVNNNRVYVRDAGIIRSFFDERVRNTKDDLYTVIFMAAVSYHDANTR